MSNYERLLAISRDDDWTAWCQFFLKAVTSQAQENQRKATEILDLYEAKKTQIVKLTHSQYSIHALDFIFGRTVFNASDFTNNAGIPAPTAKRILALLRDNGILITLREASGRRAAVYIFRELMNTAEGKKVF
jgi:Fic family protein